MHSRFPPVYIYCRFGSHCVNLLSLLYASMSLCPVSTILSIFFFYEEKNTVGSFFFGLGRPTSQGHCAVPTRARAQPGLYVPAAMLQAQATKLVSWAHR